MSRLRLRLRRPDPVVTLWPIDYCKKGADLCPEGGSYTCECSPSARFQVRYLLAIGCRNPLAYLAAVIVSAWTMYAGVFAVVWWCVYKAIGVAT